VVANVAQFQHFGNKYLQRLEYHIKQLLLFHASVLVYAEDVNLLGVDTVTIKKGSGTRLINLKQKKK
jgi:hypothetical protein